MTLTATLRKNDKRVTAITLKADRRRVTNEFSARQWIQSLRITDSDNLAVIIADDRDTIAVMPFEKHSERGRVVYKGAIDTGHLYAWANLTAGYGETWGLTACLMIRRTQHREPENISTEAPIFGDGIK